MVHLALFLNISSCSAPGNKSFDVNLMIDMKITFYKKLLQVKKCHIFHHINLDMVLSLRFLVPHNQLFHI